MKELNTVQLQEVSGGLVRVGWMFAGYVFGKTLDQISRAEWDGVNMSDITAP